MKSKQSVSNIQIRALIVSVVIGVGVLSLPSQLANIVGKDGWISIILSGLFVLPMVYIMNKLFEDHPNKDYFQIGRETLGPLIFSLFLVLYIIYYLILSAYILRIMSELIKGFLLQDTPIQVLSILFLIVSSYLAVSEIEVVARMAHMVYPFIIVFTFILMIAAIPGAELSNILPLFQSNLSQLIKSLGVSLFSFIGFEIILFALPYVENKKQTLRTCISAILIVTSIYFLLFMITLTKFSLEQIKSQSFPILTIGKLIGGPGVSFLQNLDGVILSLWLIFIFSTLAPCCFIAGKISADLFKKQSHRGFVLAILPIVYLMSRYPKNILEANNILSKLFNYLAFVNIFIVPSLIFLVGRIKRRKKA